MSIGRRCPSEKKIVLFHSKLLLVREKKEGASSHDLHTAIMMYFQTPIKLARGKYL
jgi:hypothetical protein